MSPILASALFGLAAAVVSLIALVMVRLAANFTRANAPVFAAFAAGMVVSISILHLIPEALSMAGRAPWLILAGFALGYALQRIVEAGAPEGRRLRLAASLTPVFAIATHSLIDGLVYAVTFNVGAFTGLVAAPGLVVHEFPEAVICFVLLQRAGLSDRASFGYALLAAGGTTFLTASAAAPVAAALEPGLLGGLFAIAAGLLLHVGAAHLLQHARESRWTLATPALVAGGVLAAVMAAMNPGHQTLDPGDREQGDVSEHT